jgi:hypothetical protein
MKYELNLIYFIIISTLFLGCANPFRSNYMSMLDKWPHRQSMLMEIPESAEPKLVTSKDVQEDTNNMLENGYFIIGKAVFRSPPVNEKKALAQAKDVGADVVMFKQEYTNTVSQSVPITEWMPDKKITTKENSTFQSNPGSQPSVFQREVTQTFEGETYTRYVPENVDFYEYTAIFWKKAKPLKFGVLVQPLDDATKKQLQTNRGVVVKIVTNDSPAYHADILRGDIIIKFNCEPVADTKDFFKKVKALAGKQVNVDIIRDGMKKNILLTLRE